MKCLIVDDIHPFLIEQLERAGIFVEYNPEIDKKSAAAVINNFEILVIRSKFKVDDLFMEKATNLLMIARAGAGLDNIELSEEFLSRIQLIHAAEGNADAVAEHTLGLILGLLSKIAAADRSVRSGNWDREKFRGLELKDKTVGLLGYGNMGRAVAIRLKGFGCNVISFDKYITEWPDENANRVSLETMCAESDIISIHIPLTHETKAWIGKDFLKMTKKCPLLINTSRGKIVKLEEVLGELENGSISGLGLDVFEDEPPLKKNENIPSKYERLFSRADVLLSPHIAGWSLESYEKISIVLADKILLHFSQQKGKFGSFQC